LSGINKLSQFSSMEYWSKTKVLLALRCIHAYRLYRSGVRGRKSVGMEYGKVVHSYVERVSKGELCYKDVPIRYRKPLFNYAKFLSENELSFPNFVEYEIGRDNSVDIGGRSFIGKIDAVWVRGSSGVLVDYKTGYRGKLLEDFEFELQLYSYMFKEVTGINIVRYGVVFLSSGVWDFKVNRGDYSVMYSYLEKLDSVMGSSGDVEYSDRCLDCVFRDVCNISLRHRYDILSKII